MAITSVGYDGQVTEAQWAKMIGSVGGSDYGVVNAGDWKVSAHPTIDKGVNIAPGTGWGRGVYDTSDSTYAVTCPALASGTRWDLIAVKRNWSGTGGATTFDFVTGTSTKQIPAYTSDPGNLDYQPLALVQWTAGQTAPTAMVDLRVWASNTGLVAKDQLVQNYVTRIGTMMTIGATQWQRTLGVNDVPTWRNLSQLHRAEFTGPRQDYPSGDYAYGPGSALTLNTAVSTLNPPFSPVQDGLTVLDDGQYLFEVRLLGIYGPPPAMTVRISTSSGSRLAEVGIPGGLAAITTSPLVTTAYLPAGSGIVVKTYDRTAGWSASSVIRATKLSAGV